MIEAGNFYKDNYVAFRIKKVYMRDGKKLVDFDVLWKYCGPIHYVGLSYETAKHLVKTLGLHLANEEWD